LVEFAILGTLEAQQDGEPIQLGGPKQRALLAMLLLEAGRVVSLDRLLEALWRTTRCDRPRRRSRTSSPS
jgi:DNA-binding SARP family transcriptional activator